MTEGIRQLDDFLAGFTAMVELPVSRLVLHASLGLMARHRLRSNDAVHAATALLVGVPDVATVDADFRRVPNLRLQLLRDAPSAAPPAP